MAYRSGDYETAFSLLAELPDGAEGIPEVAYHIAVVAAERKDAASVLFYLDHALKHEAPFSGIYDAMLLQAKLLQQRASASRGPDEVEMKIPLIERFDASGSTL